MIELDKKVLKQTIYDYWAQRLGAKFTKKWYLLQLKVNDYPTKGKIIAGWQKGNIITLNLNTIEKLKLDPEVVLAHEYGHLLGMPIVSGDIMDERAEMHVRHKLSDY
jgi:hypothetical protein